MPTRRRTRAAAAISGSLGLFALGLAGPLGIGSARDGSGAAAPGRVAPHAPHAHVDPTLGACPAGSLAVGILGAPDEVRVCRLEAPSPQACVEDAAGAPTQTLHVARGGRGDGTRTAPLGTIEQALAVAAEGATIVLAPGAHAAPRRAIDHVRLRGACAGGARVVGDVQVGDGATLEGLDVEGTVAIEGGAALRDLGIAGEPALRLEGERAYGRLLRVVARSSSVAIVASLGAHLDADLLRIEGGGDAIHATGEETTLALTHAEITARGIHGIRVGDRARVRVRASVVASGSDDAISVEHADLELDETALLGPARTLLDVGAGAHARLSHVALHDAREQALRATDAVVVARGLVVGAHRGTEDRPEPAAILARRGAQVELEDGLVHGARGHAVLATGRGTWLRGERLELARTRATACATSAAGCSGAPRGHAVAVTDGARVELLGSQIAGSDGCGVFVDGPSSRASVASSALRDNRVALCGDGASGDWLTLARDVHFERNESVLARPRAR